MIAFSSGVYFFSFSANLKLEKLLLDFVNLNEKKLDVSQDTINLLFSAADIMSEYLDSVLEKKEFNINEKQIEREIKKIKSRIRIIFFI